MNVPSRSSSLPTESACCSKRESLGTFDRGGIDGAEIGCALRSREDPKIAGVFLLAEDRPDQRARKAPDPGTESAEEGAQEGTEQPTDSRKCGALAMASLGRGATRVAVPTIDFGLGGPADRPSFGFYLVCGLCAHAVFSIHAIMHKMKNTPGQAERDRQ